MRIVIVLTFSILLQSCSFAPENQAAKLIGVWQDAEYLAAGWGNTYQFFQDGHFIFNLNTMDCAKREVWRSGLWRIEGNTLKLSATKKRIVVGGHFEEATGSCGTDLDLVDGKEQDVMIEPPQEQTFEMSRIELVSVKNPLDDNKFPPQQMLRITIGDKNYWKFEDDPNKYDPN